MGGDAVHPAAVAAGLVAESVTRYPVTPTLSVAVNEVTATVRLVEVAGIVNAVTVGGVVSEGGGVEPLVNVQVLAALDWPSRYRLTVTVLPLTATAINPFD